MKELISIIVPVYNVENYLDKCIESLVSQTYKNIEIILIDDGSTDNSGKMCDEWAKKDERIIIKHMKNAGVSSARNSGVKIAKGNYIGFVDADDFIKEDMFEFLLTNMHEHKSDISICSSFHIYENGKVTHEKKENINIELSNIEALICIFKTGYYGTGIWNKLFKSDLLKNNSFNIGISYGEELPVLFNAIKNSKKIFYSSVPKYYYFQRTGSATHNKKINIGMIKNFKSVISENYDFINKNEKLKKTIYSHYILSCFQVYNRSVIYQDSEKTYKLIEKEMDKYKNDIDFKDYKNLKKLQLFIFYKFRIIYSLMLKTYSIFRR